MEEKKTGRIVFMPDMEYKAWCNRNSDIVAEIVKTGKVNTLWLKKGNNKSFLIRRMAELGYRIDLT